MEELTVEAVVENIPLATEFVNRQLEAFQCPVKARVQIDIAIEHRSPDATTLKILTWVAFPSV